MVSVLKKRNRYNFEAFLWTFFRNACPDISMGVPMGLCGLI